MANNKRDKVKVIQNEEWKRTDKIETQNEEHLERQRTETSRGKRRKSPSKQIRDLRRLLAFKCRIKNTLRISTGTQTVETNGKEERSTQRNKWKNLWTTWKGKIWNSTESSEKMKPSPPENVDGTRPDTQLDDDIVVTSNPKTEKIHNQKCTQDSQPRISTIYENFENSVKLARLEEPAILTMALRHIIRRTHQNGETVVFPQIDAVDRIALRTHNLPSDPMELLNLVNQVFERRNELINLEEVYKQFVRAHGRTTFDYNQKWPQCYVFTHNP